MILLMNGNLIVAVADSVEPIDIGHKITLNGVESVYQMGLDVLEAKDITLNDIPKDFIAEKYMYESGMIKSNPNFVPTPKTTEELQREITELQKSVLDLTELVLMGGA